MIHWLAGTYAKKGITVNGEAPALIGATKMFPGDSQELAKSNPVTLPEDPEMRTRVTLKRDEKGHFGFASLRR